MEAERAHRAPSRCPWTGGSSRPRSPRPSRELGRWCQRQAHRWIWVLDGLDRLPEEDQQALPWLLQLIPEGVNLVISALDCPARAILLEREYGAAGGRAAGAERAGALIAASIRRYTKTLDPDREQKILACDLARITAISAGGAR